jgi:hypothetical protein
LVKRTVYGKQARDFEEVALLGILRPRISRCIEQRYRRTKTKFVKVSHPRERRSSWNESIPVHHMAILLCNGCFKERTARPARA